MTVAVPTRNRARLLRETIESVLAQTYEAFELVVCDNASNDDTGAVVATFGDRVRYVRSDRDVGPVANINRCLAEMDSEYGIVLCDDDLIRPSFLEQVVAVLDQHARVGLVYTACDLIGSDGSILRRSTSWNDLDVDTVESSVEFLERALAATHSRVDMSTALLRRSAIPADGFDPVDGSICDFGLWLRLAASWDVAFLAESLGATRVHGATFSAQAGALVDGLRYVRDPEVISRRRDLKLALVDSSTELAARRSALRRVTRESTRRELLVRIWSLTSPERPFARTLRLLGEAFMVERSIVFDRRAWRLLLGAALGPRLVSRLMRAREAEPGSEAGGKDRVAS